MADIHTCSYYCTRPECIKTQRDELRDRLEAQQQAEPVADQYEQAHQVIVGRYRVEKRGFGYWSHCVKAGDGTGELFVGHKSQCEKVAAALQTACLDGAWIASREVQQSAAPRIDAALRGKEQSNE